MAKKSTGNSSFLQRWEILMNEGDISRECFFQVTMRILLWTLQCPADAERALGWLWHELGAGTYRRKDERWCQ